MNETRVQPGLIPSHPAAHDLPVLLRALEPDAEQPVAVGAGARAAAAGLDPEQVVEQGHDVVVVQIAPRAPVDDERHDREPVGLEVAENADVRILRPAPDGTAPEILFVRVDHVDADRLLELEHETRADRLDDRRSSALLAHDGVVEVTVIGRPDIGHGAATHDVGHAIREQLAPHREHTGSAGAADELVRADEHGVLVRERVLRARRVHLDLDVGRGGREVPERERVVAMQHVGDRAGVREDSGHVRRCGERPDLQRTRRVRDELGLEGGEVDVAVAVLGDDDDVGDRLAPRQLVRMVLEWADEDHGPLLRRNLRGQPVAIVERRRESQAEDADQLVDRAGCTRAAEDDAGLVGAADGVVDDLARVVAQAARLQAGAGRLGVRVRVARQHLVADQVLDESERPPARRVVRVGDPAGAERPPHHLVVSDHRLPDALQQWAIGWWAHPGRVAPRPESPDS